MYRAYLPRFNPKRGYKVMSENQKNSAEPLGEEAERQAPIPAGLAHLSPPAAPVTLNEPRSATRAPNFMASRRVLPDLIEAAIERGVKVVLTKVGYELDGFYRWGPIRLEPDTKSGGLMAIDRKDVTVAVAVFDDLVRLNYECWKKSRDKGAAYINPGREWVDEFARLNLVKRQVIFVPGDD